MTRVHENVSFYRSVEESRSARVQIPAGSSKEYIMQSYTNDSRLHLSELYKKLETLKESFHVEKIYVQQDRTIKGNVDLPVYAFTSKKKGPAVWIIAGIHGEEPAGPNALAQSIQEIVSLSEKTPLVILPMCNPAGYRKNWRYPYFKKKPRHIKEEDIPSVSSSEHYLLNKRQRARRNAPVCPEAKAITSYALEKAKKYPPKLVIDLHEDESKRGTYIYAYSQKGHDDPIAQYIIKILRKHNVPLEKDKHTRFGEEIRNGIVMNAQDGSIDELMYSKKIIVNGKIKTGPSAPHVVVIETITVGIPLSKRVKIHSEIIHSIKDLLAVC